MIDRLQTGAELMPKKTMREKRPQTGVVGVRIDVGIISQIDQRARAAGLRRTDVVKKMILQGLQQVKSHPTPVGMGLN